MNPDLAAIFELEDRQAFDQAFAAYAALYAANQQQYDVWKHFYFFLWAALDEGPSDLPARIPLNQTLRNLLAEGQRHFAHTAQFNFVVGYTILILPYEFGDFEAEEQKAKAMLRKATELEPANPIYRLAYLGSLSNRSGSQQQEYEQAVSAAAPLVLQEFSGAGFLNQYFREVLYRLEE